VSQAEISEWLQKNPGWHSTKEIANSLGKQQNSVGDALKRLSRWGEVCSRKKSNGLGKEHMLAEGQDGI